MAKEWASTLESLALKAMTFSKENNKMKQDRQMQEMKPKDHGQ